MLDALEKHALGKIAGVDLGEVEWYHRLRNQLYHQGNGLTVERNKVEIYAQLANTLFQNLFGVKLVETVSEATDLFGARSFSLGLSWSENSIVFRYPAPRAALTDHSWCLT